MAGTTKLAARFAPCCEIRLLAGGRLYRQAFNYFASRYDMMTGSSERQRSSFLPNSRTPFSRLLAGFFSPPKVTPLEGLLLRVFFAVVVAYTFRFEVPFSTQPHPTGLAHFFDLTWLSNPASYSIFRGSSTSSSFFMRLECCCRSLFLCWRSDTFWRSLSITRKATHIMAFRLLA